MNHLSLSIKKKMVSRFVTRKEIRPLADVGPVTELIIHNNGGFDNGTKNLLLLALITVSRTNVENRRIRTSQITFIQTGSALLSRRNDEEPIPSSDPILLINQSKAGTTWRNNIRT